MRATEPQLAALRSLPAEKLVEGASAPQVLAGMSSGQPVIGVSGSILDGRFLTKSPEATFAAGEQAMVPVIVGANDRDLGIGMAESKDDLFALFGVYSGEARSLYDPTGNEALEELKQQILADKTLVEPSRHLADEMVRAGQPVWWYRFSYVAESLRDKWKGTLHGFEIPYPRRTIVKRGFDGHDRVMEAIKNGEHGEPAGDKLLSTARSFKVANNHMHRNIHNLLKLLS